MENNQEKKKQKRTPRKPFADLKNTQKCARKRKIEATFKTACEALPGDIKRVKVEVEFDSGTVLSFCPRKEETDKENDYLKVEKDEEKLLKLTQDILRVKDRYRISDAAMHELRMVCNALPSKNRLQDERSRQNTVLPIFSWPGIKDDCTTRRLEDVLDYVLQLPKYKTHLAQSVDPTILIRFAFDGAKITKKINSVRGVVKILEPRDNPENISMSPEDEFTLFFYIGKENRATLEKYASKTFKEMKNASENGIVVDGKHVKIEWIMTCNWKAMALIRGINPANSDYFCLWCYCRKSQICDFSIPSWSVQRSKEDQQRAIEGRERGYNLPDMNAFVPFTRMVPDDLHLRMRISLKLFNQVVAWAIDQKAEGKLEEEMRRIGINFRFWEERGDDKSSTSVKKWSQPTGDDLRIILRDLNLSNVLEERADRHFVTVDALSVAQLRDELEERGLSKKGKKTVARLKEAVGEGQKVRKKTSRGRPQVLYDLDDSDTDEECSLDIDALQDVWNDFVCLMESLTVLPTSDRYLDPDKFQESAKKWAQRFRKCTFDEDVIPYIHPMVYHVPFFLGKYKYLHDIGVAQVERKNFDHRQAYFGSTNRNGGRHREKVSIQICQRENRMLWAAHEGTERKKRQYTRKEH